MKRSHVVPVILLSKSVVGASAVAFPRFFASLGWPLALAMLSALAAATVRSTEVVLAAMADSRSSSYAGAVKATLEQGGGRGGGRGGGGGGGRGSDESDGGGRGDQSNSGSKSGSSSPRFLSSLPSLALEASGTAFSFGLLCVYNIVVADLAVGQKREKGGSSGGSGSGSAGGGGGGLLCPLPSSTTTTETEASHLPLFPFPSSLFCSRPRFTLLLNALLLVPLSLRRTARDSKVPSAIGILSLLAWAAATACLCFCAWIGGTLKVPAFYPDWQGIIAAGAGGGGGGGGVSASWSKEEMTTTVKATATATAAATLPPVPPPPPPSTPPPPSLFACLVGLCRAAGLPTSGLVCQLTAPFIVAGINAESPREAATIVREAGVLSALVYAFLGVGAGALFGSENVGANVLSNWQPEALAEAVPWLFGGGGGGRFGGGGGGAAAAFFRSLSPSSPPLSPPPPPSLAAARALSGLVRASVALSLVTMYPLLMFPCRDGTLRLCARARARRWRRRTREEEGGNGGNATEQQLLSEEGGEEREEEREGEREEGEAAAPPSPSPNPSLSSHAASTLLLSCCAALTALNSFDTAFDVLRLTGATAGAAVSYLLPAALAATQGRLPVAGALAAVGAVMVGTAL